MKVILIPALILAALVTAGCATKTSPSQDWAAAAQNAESAAGHEALAKHFDEIAATEEANAEEQRRALADYQARPHRYGRRIKDLRARSGAMLRDFEAGAADAKAMAALHREIAAEMH